MDRVFCLIDGINIKGTHDFRCNTWLTIDDANHLLTSCGSGVWLQMLKTSQRTTIIIFLSTYILACGTIPYSKEYLLQFIDGITFNTAMHIAPFAYLLGAFDVVVGYIHTTSISYTTINDYYLAVIATIDVVYPWKADRTIFYDVDAIVAECFEVIFLQWLIVGVVTKAIEHCTHLYTLTTFLAQDIKQ